MRPPNEASRFVSGNAIMRSPLSSVGEGSKWDVFNGMEEGGERRFQTVDGLLIEKGRKKIRGN